MSRAFVKDMDEVAGGELPDRLISPHPNLVTATGLAQIEAEVARLSAAYAAAQTSGDREQLDSLARDLRYWSARLASAQPMPEPTDKNEVHFGSRVTIERGPSGAGGKDAGRRQTYRIVGEDEADPAKGTLSFVAPLARALMGKSVGDSVKVGPGEAEIVEIG
jgi:transcription elongation GreA/GreB family factor